MSDFPKLSRIKQDDENMEKIHCAARRGQTELIRRLVSTGIDPNIANKFGCTALHLACKHAHLGAVRELAQAGDLSALWHGQRPLHLAVQSNNQEVVKVLVEAAKSQNKSVDSFVNENDEYEMSEVGSFEKSINGQTALHLCIGLKRIPMMKLLLSFGASATAKDKHGETPIMRAIEFNQEEAFDLLVESSPNLRLDICDKAGRSSLHWAILHNRPAMAKRLLDMGHEANMEDQEKETPVHLAAYAAMPQLLDQMLPSADAFMIQNASFHNGVQVQPDRINWLPFVSDELAKGEVIKLLQKKLDQLTKGDGKAPPGQRGKAAPAAPISFAPSAPLKK